VSIFTGLRFPEELKKKLEVIPETGYYKDEREFILEAVKTLLAARKDLRVALACKLYERGDVSLGKAMEIADLDIEAMKRVLHEHGVRRTAFEDITETSQMAEEALQAAGRAGENRRIMG
jgi:predicted HTH domain antitoxin